MEPRPSIDAVPTAGPGNHAVPDTDGVAPLPATDGVAPLPATNGAAHPPGSGTVNGVERATCTAPQLRRFIKSRPWIPLHELRRRFSINGAEDDVTAVEVDGRTVFVGLPAREGVLLGELLRGGEIGYELSLDPGAPIVIGVYPMRPVPRQ
jgi:hypothetical protein